MSHLLSRVSSGCLKPWVQDWHRLTHSTIFFTQSRVARRQCQSEKCQSTSILRYNQLSDFLSRESFWPIITNRSAHCWPSETPSMMFFACKTSYKLHQNTTQKNDITGCRKHSLGQWFPLGKLKLNRICSFPKFPKKVIWFWHWHTEACSKIKPIWLSTQYWIRCEFQLLKVQFSQVSPTASNGYYQNYNCARCTWLDLSHTQNTTQRSMAVSFTSLKLPWDWEWKSWSDSDESMKDPRDFEENLSLDKTDLTMSAQILRWR